MRLEGGVEAMGQASSPQTSLAGIASMEGVLGREHQQYYSLGGQQTRASSASRMASEENTVRTLSTMGQVGDNDRAGLDTGMGPPVEQMGAMALLGQNVGGVASAQP